jgi:hypothetical protein
MDIIVLDCIFQFTDIATAISQEQVAPKYQSDYHVLNGKQLSIWKRL